MTWQPTLKELSELGCTVLGHEFLYMNIAVADSKGNIIAEGCRSEPHSWKPTPEVSAGLYKPRFRVKAALQTSAKNGPILG